MRESEVFLMRNTKRELNPYSFYDTEGLARHFERMAAEGWAALSRRSCASPWRSTPTAMTRRRGRMCSSTTVNKRAGSTLWVRER